MEDTNLYPPSDLFRRQARVDSMEAYRREWTRSVEEPDAWWGEQADHLRWFKKWDTVQSGQVPHVKWFEGGHLNASVNCLDRIVDSGRGEKTAIIWEGEPVEDDGKSPPTPREIRKISYRQLMDDVCRFANGLKSLGVKRGDVVTIYMPMVPEAVVAMLACARIGAPHSVIFGGFSSAAIADRIADAKSKFVVTADGGWRRGKVVPLKANVDEAVRQSEGVEKVVVLRRCDNDITMADHDVWWHDVVADQPDRCEPASMDSEDLLFVLYTSGSTGKPKGILHSTAGYLLHAYLTCKYVFDMKDEDVYWCTADVGWITGHTYITYGPLAMGATQLMYEGAPNFPDFARFWQMVERHRVTVFYTAPTAIRAFMKAGRDLPDASDLSSLSLLGTVGEPINPEAWRWYHEVIGDENCPIVDTWWQTETGGHMISPLPGATPTKPGLATLPVFGIDAAVVDREGNEVPQGETGLLVIRKPWPSMLRGILGDEERYVKTYWSDVKGMYFSGDGARRDENGYFEITGRMDDVLNVSGHRLGTAEVESALVAHEAVAEAAVVGIKHEVKGEAVAAFVILRTGFEPGEDLKQALIQQVTKEIGPFARPDVLKFADGLPKTRSGKIMRRLLRDVAAGNEVKGDVTTLEDMSIVAKLQEA
ncbi:MAG: acetate--CoA ligase [Planctomycetota bacterium]